MQIQKSNLYFLIILTTIIIVLMSGCKPTFVNRPGVTAEIQVTSTATNLTEPTSTPTFIPTQTPTQEPLGQESNPIIMGFIRSDADEIVTESAQSLSGYLFSNTGLSISPEFFSSYQAVEEALLNNQLHLVWLDPIEYIVASEKQLVNAALVSNHLGVTSYGVRILSNVDSPYTSFFDEASNESTADIYTALAQFSGSRPCFVQTPSLTGNLIPKGLLLQASVPFLDPVYTYSTSANLRAVYIKGICDFTSTYSGFGDPRTASDLQQDVSDILDQVQVIWQSDSMIPNLNLSYSPNIDLPMRNNIVEALKIYIKTPEGQIVLSDLTNYSIEDLMQTDDSLYDYLRFILESQEIDLFFLLLSE